MTLLGSRVQTEGETEKTLESECRLSHLEFTPIVGIGPNYLNRELPISKKTCAFHRQMR